MAGLTCVSDWIGSDEEFFPADGPPVIDGDHAATARHAVDKCGFRKIELKKGLSFKEVFGFEPYDAQKEFIDSISYPGVYVLEAPMGMGKTEAALYSAYKLIEFGYNRGLYFALPTRLTSDRIHERVLKFLEKVSDAPVMPRLAHGMAWLQEYERGGDEMSAGGPWFNPSKRALLYPYAVGTIDQALLGVLNVKHSFVRLFGLAGKVVILDEVHSYDMYTGTLLDELVERLRSIGCTVIILSATLTSERRKLLVPLPSSVTDADAYPQVVGLQADEKAFAKALPPPPDKKIHIRMEPWSSEAVAEQAVAAARRGECVVCIANTVANAQTWYRNVKSSMLEGDDFHVGILHSRFPLFKRSEIEEKWMNALGKGVAARPRGCVLVSTQIVEQSVDIDADWMISEIAPTDMLLQRMGRLWRHNRKIRPREHPEIVIIAQDPTQCVSIEGIKDSFGKANCSVYSPYVLMRTYDVWNTRKTVVLPEDIRGLLEGTYVENAHQPEDVMQDLKENLAHEREHLRKLACSAKDSNHGLPSGEDSVYAATRYSDLPMRTTLLLAERPEIQEYGRAKVTLMDGTEWVLDPNAPNFAATRQLHANVVSLATYILPEYNRDGAVVSWLNRHFFDKPVVLLVNEAGVLVDLNGVETKLRYSLEYGIWRDNME